MAIEINFDHLETSLMFKVVPKSISIALKLS
jgi:hypothetical protein